MKPSTILLLIGGVLIGFALVAQFEPIRSDWGHLSSIALILGVAAAFMGVALGRRKPRV